jgi:hypothetical protein
MKKTALPFLFAATLAAGAFYVHLRTPVVPTNLLNPLPPVPPVVHTEPARVAPVAVRPQAPDADAPLIQVALLLDTSSSMDGLIDQARTRLWNIVNDLTHARRDGKLPRLQIGLYEYGKDTIPAAQGYLRQVLPFTESLDQVSEQLFSLRTNGGEEYCGRVLETATDTLGWSHQADALKMIFIAGNEPFTQGPVDPLKSIAHAREQGIAVHPIFCGPASHPDAASWRVGADKASVALLTIDQDKVAQEPPAPQDQEIARLGVEINETYVGYGRLGGAAQARQQAQDVNMAGSLGGSVARSISKANTFYSRGNVEWDVVDNYGAHGEAALREDQLPDSFKGLSEAERVAKVEGLKSKRAEIQARINQLARERQAFLVQQRAVASTDTFDGAAIGAVRTEAKAQRFTFE